MKRILYLLALILACATMRAQNPDIDKIIAEANAKCPMATAEGLVLQSVTATDSALVLNYTVADDMYDNLNDMKGLLHDAMLAELLSTPDTSTQHMVNFCRSRRVNFVQNFAGKGANKFTLVFKPEDM